MTQQETNEYNERCARFLGANRFNNEYELFGIVEVIEDGETEKHFFEPKDMLFHTDWSWIMEVVEGIEKLFNNEILVEITNRSCYIGIDKDYEKWIEMTTKKQAVIEAVNQFLIWNEKQTTL